MEIDRINDKIEQIEKYLSELYEFFPYELEIYLRDFGKKAASERYFEKVVEAIVDLVFLVIKEKKLKIPEDEESSFIILADNNIISLELAKRLKDAKGMRNFIAHEYGEIDDVKVFNAINEQLEADVKEFINSIKVILKKRKE